MTNQFKQHYNKIIYISGIPNLSSRCPPKLSFLPTKGWMLEKGGITQVAVKAGLLVTSFFFIPLYRQDKNAEKDEED